MAKKHIPTPAPSSATSSPGRPSIQEAQEQQKERAKSTNAPGNARSARAAKPAAASAAIGKPTGANGKAKAAPGKTSSPRRTPGGEIEREKIALRAYFISERRRAQGECREPSEDWLEAERELTAEVRRAAKAKS